MSVPGDSWLPATQISTKIKKEKETKTNRAYRYLTARQCRWWISCTNLCAFFFVLLRVVVCCTYVENNSKRQEQHERDKEICEPLWDSGGVFSQKKKPICRTNTHIHAFTHSRLDAQLIQSSPRITPINSQLIESIKYCFPFSSYLLAVSDTNLLLLVFFALALVRWRLMFLLNHWRRQSQFGCKWSRCWRMNVNSSAHS